jgi:uncharacterized protein with PQ loop repeat
LNLPQVWRTCIKGLSAGVPASRAWVAIAVAEVWLGYGLYRTIAVQVVLNAIVLLLNVALLTRLPRARSTAWMAGLVGTAIAVVGFHSLGGSLAVGTAGAVSGSLLCLPQLLAVRRTSDIDGISRASLWLQVMGAGCWLTYGLLRLETVVWIPNIFVLTTTLATLALLATTSREALAGKGFTLSTVGLTGQVADALK